MSSSSVGPPLGQSPAEEEVDRLRHQGHEILPYGASTRAVDGLVGAFGVRSGIKKPEVVR
jgi:hypothetical protein